MAPMRVPTVGQLCCILCQFALCIACSSDPPTGAAGGTSGSGGAPTAGGAAGAGAMSGSGGSTGGTAGGTGGASGSSDDDASASDAAEDAVVEAGPFDARDTGSFRDSRAESDIATDGSDSEGGRAGDGGTCDCPGTPNLTHLPLECRCGPNAGIECPSLATLDVPKWCKSVGSGDLIRKAGCGKIAYSNPAGHIGETDLIFDAASGDLVGFFEGSDFPTGPCTTFSYMYGEDFDNTCPDVATCYPCTPDAGRPACP